MSSVPGARGRGADGRQQGAKGQGGEQCAETAAGSQEQGRGEQDCVCLGRWGSPQSYCTCATYRMLSEWDPPTSPERWASQGTGEWTPEPVLFFQCPWVHTCNKTHNDLCCACLHFTLTACNVGVCPQVTDEETDSERLNSMPILPEKGWMEGRRCCCRAFRSWQESSSFSPK